MLASLFLSVSLAAPPADLAMVPPDAIAVVHIHAKELWSSALASGIRVPFEKAGHKALASFEEAMYPPAETIDRLTLIITPPGSEGTMDAILIIRFDSAFDVAKVRTVYGESGDKPKTATTTRLKSVKSPIPDDKPSNPITPINSAVPDGKPGKTITLMLFPTMELAVPDDHTIIIGGRGTLDRFLSRKAGAARPIIAQAIAKADSSTIVVAGDLGIIPPGVRDIKDMPQLKPLLQAKTLLMTVDAKKDTTITLSAGYTNADTAAEAEKGVRKAITMAMGEARKAQAEMEKALYESKKPNGPSDLPKSVAALWMIGSTNQLDEFVKSIPMTRTDDQLTVTVKIPEAYTGPVTTATAAIGVGLLLPAVQKVREAAGRMNGLNNLKQIGLAMHNYHDATLTFPTQSPTSIRNDPSDPKKRLSWRVHLLPYLELDPLYKQFHLDEPWDSDHNKKLIPRMPKVYMEVRFDAGEGKTFYKGIAGKGLFFDGEKGRQMTSITDGTSNTAMVIAGGDPVIWTKPDDHEIDFTKALPDFSKPFGPATGVLFCDGSFRTIDFSKLDAKTIKALLTVAGGEVVNVP